MPWQCPNTECATMVAQDDILSCPSCGTAKASWTLVADKTRTMVLGARKKKVDCRRGHAVPTRKDAPFLHVGASWTTTTAASVLPKATARALSQAHQLPDPYDVLCVRMSPGKKKKWPLKMTTLPTKRPSSEVAFEFERKPEELPEEGYFAVYFLCVAGEEDAAGIEFPHIVVLDVTDETELGHAAELTVSGLRGKPIPISLAWRDQPGVAARWEGLARHGATARMIAEGPFDDGDTITFHVEVEEHGPIGEPATTSASGGRASVEWSQWFTPGMVGERVELAQGDAFPTARFRFTARGAFGEVASELLEYEDWIKLTVLYPGEEREPAAELPYRVLSQWGTRAGVTNEAGELEEKLLPPGGATIAVGDRVLTV